MNLAGARGILASMIVAFVALLLAVLICAGFAYAAVK